MVTAGSVGEMPVWYAPLSRLRAIQVPIRHRLLRTSAGKTLVEIDWTADTRPTGIRSRGGEHVIEVRTPEVESITVLDKRWGRDEALEVKLTRDAP